jgi:hypothetical protein
MQTGTHIKRQPFDKEAGEVVSGAHQLTLKAETGGTVVSPESAKQLRVLTQTENKKPEGGT